MRIRNQLIMLTAGVLLAAGPARASDGPPCNPETLRNQQMFNCSMPENLDALLQFRAPTAYKDKKARNAFPRNWRQLGYDQRHNPFFPVKDDDAPEFLEEGTFWAAPITGDEFLRLARALKYFPQDGGQSWGATVAAALGNVMGVSATHGIIYAPVSRNAVWAIDAKTGYPIWKADLINNAGMGQVVVEEIDGKPVVFVASGDSVYNLENTIAFTNNQPHDRGANFSAVYAFDGLTGAKKWEFHTQGASRPSPVYRDGKLYIANGDGHLYILNAGNGSLISTFTNPGEGHPGLASPNWYKAPDGRVFILYGTIRPGNILAVDVTNPAAPTLGWRFAPPGAASNAPGDTPVAVDPATGLLLTNVFTSTATAGVFDLVVYAIDAATGAVRWSVSAGTGPNIPGFKGSVPMIHGNVVYMGNSLNETYRAYDIATGTLLWATNLQEPDDQPAQRHRPGAAGVYIDGKILHAEGRDIRTFDAATGAILNQFETPGSFSAWGVTQPVVVGNMAYLGALSGWVFAAPLDYLMTSPGFGERAFPPPHPVPAQQPEYANPAALPTNAQAGQFPSTWLAYAGGQTHNAYVSKGPSGIRWEMALNEAIPLSAPARDEAIFGPETAAHMTQLAFGASTGIAPVKGIAYVGSERYTVNALNAVTGELIWRYRSINANLGQPIVTPKTVVVGAGDPWMALQATASFKAKSPQTFLGGSFEHLTGLDPRTGVEKWTFYSAIGTSAMTPLHHKGNLYWVNGDGRVWAINADTGAPVAPFMDANGFPKLSLGGFNAVASANIYRQSDDRPAIMVIGKAMPNEFVGIDLDNARVLWKQTLAPSSTYVIGFSAASPAVDQKRGLVVSTVFADPDSTQSSATLLAFALNAKTGAVAWKRELSRGETPYGFVGPTPLIDGNSVFLTDPVGRTMVALDVRTGAPLWQSPLSFAEGKPSWGPGVVVDDDLIQPVGQYLHVFDKRTGAMLNHKMVGGAFIYQHPTVIGDTLYIGNSWGWAHALPLEEVTGHR